LNRADQCNAADLESNGVVTLQLPSGEAAAGRTRLSQARVKRRATALIGTDRTKMSIYEGGSSGQTPLVELRIRIPPSPIPFDDHSEPRNLCVV